MQPFIVILLILLAFAVYTIIKRISRGTYVANDRVFSQAGVTVNFEQQQINIKGKSYNINSISKVRTEKDDRGRAMAFDCIICLKDLGHPEHRIRFINRDQANRFMQRLCTAIEQAGGPSYT